MVELNLLPPAERELLRLEKIRCLVMRYGTIILLTFLGFVAVLGFIWFFILIQLKSYSQSLQSIEASFQGQSIGNQKQLIADFNQYLEKLGQTQKNHPYYSSVLAELADIIPAGVRLDSLSIDEKNQVVLSGFAPQRSQVLILQDSLEGSKFFADVEKPLENLTKQTNINFNFKFKLLTEKLVNE